MAKETYSDKDLLMLKGLYHVSIAKQYFETSKIDKEFLIKNIFNSYCNRLDYILNSVNSMVNGESKEILDQEILKGDTLFFGSMADKMIELSATQREEVELIINLYLTGEDEAISDVINISKLNPTNISKRLISEQFVFISKEDLSSNDSELMMGLLPGEKA